MYAVGSTQKCHWTFGSREELRAMREEANRLQVEKYRPVMGEEGSEEMMECAAAFLTPSEEALLCRIVSENGVRFGDDFQPKMWDSVRWIAFAYFKRFYLHHSAMEYSPKGVMMGCYFLATKVDEFNVSIDQFIDNLKVGSREQNIETTLTLEPVLLAKLRYHLTVHTPYRAFEGLLIEAKTLGQWGPNGFDLGRIRGDVSEFFKKALLSDAMLLYPPSQLALAAMKHGLERQHQPQETLQNFLLTLMLRGEESSTTPETAVEALLYRLEDIVCCVHEDFACSSNGEDAEMEAARRERLKQRFSAMSNMMKALDARLKALPGSQKRPGTPVDSDDEL